MYVLNLIIRIANIIPEWTKKVEEMGPWTFSFSMWRAGSLAEFGIETRYASIKRNRHIIRKYAIGFLDASKLWVRPKLNAVAIMFWCGRHFWTHLSTEEFIECFPELKNYVKSGGDFVG